MSRPCVTIVDYGVGNLKSVRRAFEHAGGNVTITADANAIAKADRLVLPGVGAFGHCMDELRARSLLEPIRSFAENGRPFLGICVGMQIMLSAGEEFGEHEGLGLIPGRVKKIAARKLPYIGWAALHGAASSWKGTALDAVRSGEHVYFLHSFTATCDNPAHAIAVYDYDGLAVCAAIAKDHLTGVQFHPEKSAEVGLRIIRRFLSL